MASKGEASKGEKVSDVKTITVADVEEMLDEKVRSGYVLTKASASNVNVVTMECVKRLLGCRRFDRSIPSDENNTHVRFFLDHLKQGYGPYKRHIDKLLRMRLKFREALILPLNSESVSCVANPKAVDAVLKLYPWVLMNLYTVTLFPDVKADLEGMADRVYKAVDIALYNLAHIYIPTDDDGELTTADFPEDNVCTLTKNLICDLAGAPHSASPPFVFFYQGAFDALYKPSTGERRRLMEQFYMLRRQTAELTLILATILFVPEAQRTSAQQGRLRDLQLAHKQVLGETFKVAVSVREALTRGAKRLDPHGFVKKGLSEIVFKIVSLSHPTDVEWASEYYTTLLCGRCVWTEDYYAPLASVRATQGKIAYTTCKTCNAPSDLEWVHLSPCSKCKTAIYCSKECQTVDWKAGHKKECGVIAQRPKKVAAPSAECSNCGASSGVALLACNRCKDELYCGKACQTQHWKVGGHRRFCVAKEDRIPPTALELEKMMPPSGDRCAVCMDALTSKVDTTLTCGHKLHHECVDSIKAYGVAQVCPVCRSSL
jgi:hypothetical protein